MTTRAAQVVRSIHHQPFWVEVWSGVAIALWAGEVFRAARPLASLPPYRLLLDLAPAQVWGALALLAGAVQITTALLHVRAMRGVVDVLMAVIWLLLADGVRQGTPGNPTLGICEAMTLANLQAAAWLLLPVIKDRWRWSR